MNSDKYLNFLAFVEAYLLYTEANNHKALIKPELDKIKLSMNTKRTNYELPVNHAKISDSWLLGFTEGDGSFSYEKRNGSLIYHLG